MAEEKRRWRLSREVVVAAALGIADREGLDALSMRRLGAELGVDPTAAYRHLPDKKALPAGVVEAALSGADVETDRAMPWQDQFRSVARANREAMLAHSPAVARLAATTPLNSLGSLRIVEHGVTILATPGVPLPERINAIQAVGQLTTGSVPLESFWREWAAAGGEIHLSPPMLPHPELPTLSDAATEDFLAPEQVFELGLDAIVGRLEPMARPPKAGGPAGQSGRASAGLRCAFSGLAL